MWFAKNPAGYPKPTRHMIDNFQDCWSLMFMPGLSKSFLHKLDRVPDSSFQLYVWQIANIQRWQALNGVTIFPESNLVEKCLHTDVLETITGQDLKIALPSVMFVLPSRQAVRGDKGEKISFLVMNVVDGHEPLVAQFRGTTRKIIMPEGPERYLVVTALWDNSEVKGPQLVAPGQTPSFITSFTLPLFKDQTIKQTLQEYSQSFVEDELRSAHLTNEEKLNERREMERIGLTLGSLIINFLLIMSNYPQYINRYPGLYDRPYRQKNLPDPATYGLRQMGSLRPPKVVEQPLFTEPREGMEQRKSPKSHWRRGHWRRQPHDTKWEQLHPHIQISSFNDGRHYHMLWIEPQLVALKD